MTRRRKLCSQIKKRSIFAVSGIAPRPVILASERSRRPALPFTSAPARLCTKLRARHTPRKSPPECRANIDGVSMHANVSVPARDRRRLERLCRYVARPPIATKRLSSLPDGRLLYRLKHRWRDGTTHVVFDPLELIERIAAVIPPPRAHLVRYHGVLAPAAHRRAQIGSPALAPATPRSSLPRSRSPVRVSSRISRTLRSQPRTTSRMLRSWLTFRRPPRDRSLRR
jgi:hypothetical protein